MEKTILLLYCIDQKGIVSKVTTFLYKNNANILSSNQHSDHKSNMFYMRIEFDISNFSIKKQDIEIEFYKNVAKILNISFKIYFENEKINSAIFVSGYAHCLIDILLKNNTNDLDMNIKAIISNHDDMEKIVKKYSPEIDFFYIPIDKNTKEIAEKKEIEILKKCDINLIILARYMQILSSNFISLYENKIINIHHSFLPAFMGANPYKKAFDRGVKLIGATSHYATSILDDGPIIEQDVIRITHKDSEMDLVNRGKDLEKKVLSRAIKLHLEHKILVDNKKTIIFD